MRRKNAEKPQRGHAGATAVRVPLPVSAVTWEPAARARELSEEVRGLQRGPALPRERRGMLGAGSSRGHGHGHGQPGARAPPGGSVGRRLGRPPTSVRFC